MVGKDVSHICIGSPECASLWGWSVPAIILSIYANRRGASRLYLLYPLYRNHKPDATEVVFNILDGEGASAKKIPLQILQVPFSFGESPVNTKQLLLSILTKTIHMPNCTPWLKAGREMKRICFDTLITLLYQAPAKNSDKVLVICRSVFWAFDHSKKTHWICRCR